MFIYDQPNVEFSWNNACAGENVEFINLSINSFDDYGWQFIIYN